MKDEKTGANIPLSPAERLRIIQILNALPRSQFEELVFILNIPQGVVPPNSASQGVQSVALLTWAESLTGPGLHELKQILSEMVGTFSRPETIAFSLTGVEERLTTEELESIVKLFRSNNGNSSIEFSIE